MQIWIELEQSDPNYKEFEQFRNLKAKSLGSLMQITNANTRLKDEAIEVEETFFF